MQLPQRLARFNRHVTNPIQRMWAGWAPGFGILEHSGRKSGKTYRTPLNVFTTDDGVAILLSYGPDRDWLKNITVAGGGTLKRRGQTFRVTDPPGGVPGGGRRARHRQGPSGIRAFGKIPFEQAVLLTRG
ncbi:MAG: nitroreductase family deazaflavin-dependent oxidoreductase [Mycobacterium sp.]|nr:nitroreductase family deazaflavin-dependent oxidoreductase [Mycobacterium sp.]